METEKEQGENIKISFTFRDIGGHLSNLDSVEVDIYPYGKHPGQSHVEESDRVLEGGIPVNISLGYYEFEYSIPEDAQVGTWSSHWKGAKGEQSIQGIVDFEVLPNPNSPFPETQKVVQVNLKKNHRYSVTVNNIKSVDGDVLDKVSLYFVSELSPMCITYESLKAKLSNIVSLLDKESVSYMIWELSKEVRLMIPSGHICNQEYLSLACAKWVEYLSSLYILRSIVGGGGFMKSKQLGDLKVAYSDNSNPINQMINTWESEASKWERVINSRGCIPYGGSFGVKIAHPSICNPDRPKLGRQIREAIGSSQMADSKDLFENRTRYQHSYGSGERYSGTSLEDWHYD